MFGPAIVAGLLATASAVFQPQWESPQSITAYRNATQGNGYGTLYAVAAAGYTDGPIILADIHGSHYEAGYIFATLLEQESLDNYAALMNDLTTNALLQGILGAFMDWQYESYLTTGLSQDFIDELQGVKDAAAALNNPNLSTYINRALTMASIATGDVKNDILYLLLNEFSAHGDTARAYLKALRGSTGMTVEEVATELAAAFKALGRSCSMISAWGSRTQGGQLYTGRNLDWDADSGISKHKLVTVYHITGKNVYASVGFAGLVGALTGMSAPGLTVHETGNDNKEETLKGFVWSLRLRALMENAGNLAEAIAFWKATNNTLGINHGIGSAADQQFLALETKAGYTAYFKANDPREANLVVNGTHYGFPMPEALWRTNHGYDPQWLSTVVGSEKPGRDTFLRYMLIHDTLVQYQQSNTIISDAEALNITAVPGDKGGSTAESFVTCGPSASGGSNIISAMFVPGQQVMYVAFENGHLETHSPASCNPYVKLNMTQWFQS